MQPLTDFADCCAVFSASLGIFGVAKAHKTSSASLSHTNPGFTAKFQRFRSQSRVHWSVKVFTLGLKLVVLSSHNLVKPGNINHLGIIFGH